MPEYKIQFKVSQDKRMVVLTVETKHGYHVVSFDDDTRLIDVVTKVEEITLYSAVMQTAIKRTNDAEL